MSDCVYLIKYNMFVFNIDRGGTFTDFYVQKVTG